MFLTSTKVDVRRLSGPPPCPSRHGGVTSPSSRDFSRSAPSDKTHASNFTPNVSFEGTGDGQAPGD